LKAASANRSDGTDTFTRRRAFTESLQLRRDESRTRYPHRSSVNVMTCAVLRGMDNLLLSSALFMFLDELLSISRIANARSTAGMLFVICINNLPSIPASETYRELKPDPIA
jgi:hypothetical protein